MFRPTSRLIARSSALRTLPRAAPAGRFLSTASPTAKSRSWKNSAARWGIAGAILYYYNTSDVFAEEPRYAVQTLPTTEEETEAYQTIDAISKERAQRKEAEKAAIAAKLAEQDQAQTAAAGQEQPAADGMEGLEGEADQQGAFNPETGEINWDCPCLGGMAHGPCGEEFKAAFSCFVFSTEEPKGMDCIDKFKSMQNCFRQHPEVYGAELESDEEDDEIVDQSEPGYADATPPGDPPTSIEGPSTEKVSQKATPASEKGAARVRAKAATEQVKQEHEPLSESDSVIPKAAHDERQANEDR
ncbi:hypothetical protein CC78DRAFT_618800 [Lojkania enalia]|uniref:Mitochondrial intermembrane space import and assembly protein 40 n=1 Tax=Lojkania enalia TaxID=147567 RepID=A0A9P4K8W9_9PLEO|nr:hypothetical protein CC78DRAFT_618800 [Didymosphaeria enalia]